MFNDIYNHFNVSKKVQYSVDLYNDFILQLGGKRFGNGVFNG
jgi:hypothetical protein